MHNQVGSEADVIAPTSWRPSDAVGFTAHFLVAGRRLHTADYEEYQMLNQQKLCMARSLLFVPGNRPDRFTKAVATGADGVVLDLEDAVGESNKDEARDAVTDLLARESAVIRINPPGSSWYDADLAALEGGPRLVMLPKASLANVREVLPRLPAGSTVIALIETATGVLDARDIAATPGVGRLALGNVDLATELGIDPDDREALLGARSQLVLSAAAAGMVPPLDGVTTAIHDESQLSSDARYAVALGFTGKLCIHPKQVAWVHQAFEPTNEQLTFAERVLAAVAEHDGSREGDVVMVEGKMVDKPVYERAERIAALHRRGTCGVECATPSLHQTVDQGPASAHASTPSRLDSHLQEGF